MRTSIAVTWMLFITLQSGVLNSQVPTQDVTIKTFRYQGPAVGALLRVGQEAKLPVGIICGSTSALQDVVDLDLTNISASSVLDRVLSALGDYRWHIDSGILHVTPSKSPAAEMRALTFPIKKFYSPSVSPEVVGASLRGAVLNELNPGEPRPSGVINMLSTPVEGDKPLSLDNTTVEAILDAAVFRSKGLTAWVVPPLEEDFKTVMRTRPPWYLGSYPTLIGKASSLCSTPK